MSRAARLWPQAAALALVTVALLLGSCKRDEEPPGQLMLALTTDLQPGKDFDSVSVEVLSFGSREFKNDYAVGPSGLKLPATLGLVAGKKPDEPVTIRVLSSLRGQPRTLREVVTTIPEDRVATLTVKIEWFCLDWVVTTDEGVVDSTCPEGETCVAGSCVEVEVDSATLPTYRASELFGGGDGSGSGACFDTVACFAEGYGAEIELDDCTLAAAPEPEAGQGVSVAPKEASG